MRLVEGESCEFKRELTPRLVREVVAFLNRRGGTIYIGVEDDGSPCGVSDPVSICAAAESMVRDAIRPDAVELVRCDIVHGDDYQGGGALEGGRAALARPDAEQVAIVRMEVSPGVSKPYFLRGKGLTPHGVYVRQGSSSIPASETVIRRMVREADGERFEDLRCLDQELTFAKARTVFEGNGLAWGEAQMRTLGMLSDDGVYTNLALLLSDQCPSYIKAAWFSGVAEGPFAFRNRAEFAGSIFQQVEDAFQFIDQRNNLASEMRGLERIDVRDYPVEAVREALLNAIVHREFAYSDATLIKMFDDCMQVVNLGGIADGIDLQDITAGVSRLRNPKLANVFFRLGFIEAYGTGMARISGSYRFDDMKPRVTFSKGAFSVELPCRSYRGLRDGSVAMEDESLASDGIVVEDASQPRGAIWLRSRTAEGLPSLRNAVRRGGGRTAPGVSFEWSAAEEALRFIEIEGSVTRRQVEVLLGVGQTTAGKLLRALVEEGAIRQEGRGPSTRYKLAG